MNTKQKYPPDVSGGYKNSIVDSCTPHPGETVFNTLRHRSSETLERSGNFQGSVNHIKVQIMFTIEKIISKRQKLYVKIQY